MAVDENLGGYILIWLPEEGLQKKKIKKPGLLYYTISVYSIKTANLCFTIICPGR